MAEWTSIVLVRRCRTYIRLASIFSSSLVIEECSTDKFATRHRRVDEFLLRHGTVGELLGRTTADGKRFLLASIAEWTTE
jgi:hypothetical protein